MTHIQLEIQTSVPTKRSLVIMIKPGHLSNVTLEAVHQQDHHHQSVGHRRGPHRSKSAHFGKNISGTFSMTLWKLDEC